ncbi:transposase domain-containing protein, partial [Streptomyces sp. NPDC057426]|uniref:transposase domain-containing protein n=1 Tax=Streptomyces sp. NPDC057426 TaxID=3346128 RepID=UPI0036AE2BC9
MARVGQVRVPAGERLSDRIAIGVLTRAFPPQLIDEVVAETGRGELRSRLLPARVVVYFVLAMGTCPRVVDTSEPGPARGRVGGISYGDEGLLAR